MPYILLAVLTVTVAFAVVRSGGVSHTEQNFFLFPLALAAIAAALFLPRIKPRRLSPVYRWLLPILPAVAIFQLLPLPASWVVALSPARSQGIAALSGMGVASPNATITVYPTATRDYILLICAYIVIFLIVRQLTGAFSDRLWILILPLLLIGVWETVVALIQAAAGTIVAGNYVNRNHFSGLLEMLLPFAAVWPLAHFRTGYERRELSTADGLKIGIAWTLAALFLIVVILSQSRMGFITCMFALLVAGVLVVLTKRHALPNRRSVYLLLGGVAIVIGLALVTLPTGELIQRFGDATVSIRKDGTPEASRYAMWRETIQLIKTYPWLGCGVGGYFAAYTPFKHTDPQFTVDRAHNDYLQILAEFGIPTGLVVFVLAGFTLWNSIRRAFAAKRADSWVLAIASTASLAAIALHSTVDFNLYIPANAMVLCWVAALSTYGT